MKILLISYYFPPTNAIGAVRVGKLAKYLLAQGHDVRVLTAAEPFLPKSLPVEFPERRIVRTRTVDLDRLPLKLFPRRATVMQRGFADEPPIVTWLAKLYKTFITIPDGQIAWLPFALRIGRRILRKWRPDLIYASAMPFTSLLVARHLSWEFEVPWVAELRDLWVDSHYYEYPFWRRALETGLERSILASTSAMVTVSEPLAQTLRGKYGKPTAVILNGFDPEDYPRDRTGPGAEPDRIRIVYTGLIYPRRRDPSPLFEALHHLGPQRRHFIVDFYGRRLPEIAALAERYGVADVVRVHDPVSYKDAVRLQAEADVLLLLLWNTAGERGVFTGKLFEYLGAGRPILCLGLEAGVAADLIRNRKAGFVANDPGTIANQLRAWLVEKQQNGSVAPLPESTRAGLSRDAQFSVLNGFLQSTLATIKRPPKKAKLRVFHVITGLQTGGAERMLTSLVTSPWAESIDFRVVSLTRGGNFMARLREAGVTVFDLNMRGLISAPFAFFRLVRIIRRYRPHVIQSWMYHADLTATLALIFSMRRRQTRLYWGICCSNMDPRHYSPFLRYTIRICAWLSFVPDKIVANSRSGLQYHQELGYRPQSGMVIENGVDTIAFHPDSETRSQVRRELRVDGDPPLLAMVARKDPMKDHATFFSALEKVPNAVALLIGRDTDQFPDIPRVLKLGETTDIGRLLSACDLTISSSAFGEGFSNALLEGMSCGLPAVATDVGDAREIIGDTGLIVPPGNSDALATAINTLLEEPEDSRLRRRERVRDRIVKNYSLETAVKKFSRLYNGQT